MLASECIVRPTQREGVPDGAEDQRKLERKTPFIFELTFPDGSVKSMTELEAREVIEDAHRTGIEIGLCARFVQNSELN